MSDPKPEDELSASDPILLRKEIKKYLKEMLEYSLYREDTDPSKPFIVSLYKASDELYYKNKLFENPDSEKLKEFHAILAYSLGLIKNPDVQKEPLPPHLIKKTGWLAPLSHSLEALFNAIFFRNHAQTKLNRAFFDLSAFQQKKGRTAAALPPMAPPPPAAPPVAPPSPNMQLRNIKASGKNKQEAKKENSAPDRGALLEQIKVKGAKGLVNKKQKIEKQAAEAKRQLELANSEVQEATRAINKAKKAEENAKAAYQQGIRLADRALSEKIIESYEKVYHIASSAYFAALENRKATLQAQEKAKTDFDLVSAEYTLALAENQAEKLTKESETAKVNQSAAETAVVLCEKAQNKNIDEILTDAAVLIEIVQVLYRRPILEGKSINALKAEESNAAITRLIKTKSVATEAEQALELAKKIAKEAEDALNAIQGKGDVLASVLEEAKEKAKAAVSKVTTAMESVKSAREDVEAAVTKIKKVVLDNIDTIEKIDQFMKKNAEVIAVQVKEAQGILKQREKFLSQVRDNYNQIVENELLNGDEKKEDSKINKIELAQTAVIKAESAYKQAVAKVDVLEVQLKSIQQIQEKIRLAKEKQNQLIAEKQKKSELKEKSVLAATEATQKAAQARSEVTVAAIAMIQLQTKELEKKPLDNPDRQRYALEAKKTAIAEIKAKQAFEEAEQSGVKKSIERADETLRKAKTAAKSAAALLEKLEVIEKTEKKLTALALEETRANENFLKEQEQYKKACLAQKNANQELSLMTVTADALTTSLEKVKPIALLNAAEIELKAAREGIASPAEEESIAKIAMDKAAEEYSHLILDRLAEDSVSNQEARKQKKGQVNVAKEIYSLASHKLSRIVAAQEKVDRSLRLVEKLSLENISPEEKIRHVKIFEEIQHKMPQIMAQKEQAQKKAEQQKQLVVNSEKKMNNAKKELENIKTLRASTEKTLLSHKKALRDVEARSKLNGKGTEKFSFLAAPGAELKAGIESGLMHTKLRHVETKFKSGISVGQVQGLGDESQRQHPSSVKGRKL